jgi:hypothetical protein
MKPLFIHGPLRGSEFSLCRQRESYQYQYNSIVLHNTGIAENLLRYIS